MILTHLKVFRIPEQGMVLFLECGLSVRMNVHLVSA
jgi:hypothetical protein